MEINDFGELNALYKLFGKVKFQDDLDFNEFKEFANSPIIANIYKRLNEEYRREAKKLGYIKSDDYPKFIFDSSVGKVIRKRIDEYSDNDRLTLAGLSNKEFDNHLKTLICPLESNDDEFKLLKRYATDKIKKAST